MSIIYIAGPMSGMENFNRTAFAIAARNLDAKGHTVLNPAILPDGLTYEHYMDIGLAMLRGSDAIYLLEGWEDSEGAKREFNLAVRLRLDISTPESRKGGAS